MTHAHLPIHRVGLAALAALCLLAAAPAARAQLNRKTLVHGGVTRTWYEHVPASYDGTSAVPLVVVLHGLYDTGDQFAPKSEWTPVSDQQGFIVVYPNGGLGSGNSLGWNDFVYDGSAPDDVGFLHQLIQTLKSTYRVDPNRVYMTGFSNGGSVTYTFCGNGFTSDLAAIAPCGSDWMTAYGIPESIQRPGATVSAWIERGDLDDDQIGNQSRDVQDANQTAYWVGIDGCRPTPQNLADGSYTTSIYTGGQGEVRYSRVAGYGHQYGPGFAAKIWTDCFSRTVRNAAPTPTPIPVPTPTPIPVPLPTPTPTPTPPSPTPAPEPTPIPTPRPPSRPVVTLTAIRPTASALDGTPGAFLIMRAGNASQDVVVNYAVSGWAVNGTDYATLPGQRMVTAAQGSARVRVVPLGARPDLGGHRGVWLHLLPGDGYIVARPSWAKVLIQEPVAP